MSLDFVFERTKKIERLLRGLGAEGRGMHDLVTSVESHLPRDIVRAARKIASIRNKLAHRDDFSLNEQGLQGFDESANFVIQALTEIIDQRNAATERARRVATQQIPSASTNTTSFDHEGTNWNAVGKFALWAAVAIISAITANK